MLEHTCEDRTVFCSRYFHVVTTQIDARIALVVLGWGVWYPDYGLYPCQQCRPIGGAGCGGIHLQAITHHNRSAPQTAPARASSGRLSEGPTRIPRSLTAHTDAKITCMLMSTARAGYQAGS